MKWFLLAQNVNAKVSVVFAEMLLRHTDEKQSLLYQQSYFKK